MGTLNQQSPELAQSLRRKTFFLEDLNVITAGGLRLGVSEGVGYPTAALALRDEKAEIRTALLGRLPVAMREILQQELDLSSRRIRTFDDRKPRSGFWMSGGSLLADGRIAYLRLRLDEPEGRDCAYSPQVPSKEMRIREI